MHAEDFQKLIGVLKKLRRGEDQAEGDFLRREAFAHFRRPRLKRIDLKRAVIMGGDGMTGAHGGYGLPVYSMRTICVSTFLPQPVPHSMAYRQPSGPSSRSIGRLKVRPSAKRSIFSML